MVVDIMFDVTPCPLLLSKWFTLILLTNTELYSSMQTAK